MQKFTSKINCCDKITKKIVFDFSYSDTLFLVLGNATVVMKTKVGSDHTPATIYHISFGKMGDGYMTVTDNGCIPVLYQVTTDINGGKYSRIYRKNTMTLDIVLKRGLGQGFYGGYRQFQHLSDTLYKPDDIGRRALTLVTNQSCIAQGYDNLYIWIEYWGGKPGVQKSTALTTWLYPGVD